MIGESMMNAVEFQPKLYLLRFTRVKVKTRGARERWEVLFCLPGGIRNGLSLSPGVDEFDWNAYSPARGILARFAISGCGSLCCISGNTENLAFHESHKTNADFFSTFSIPASVYPSKAMVQRENSTKGRG